MKTDQPDIANTSESKKDMILTWCSCSGSCSVSVASLPRWRRRHWLDNWLENVIILTVVQRLNLAATATSWCTDVLSSASNRCISLLPVQSWKCPPFAAILIKLQTFHCKFLLNYDLIHKYIEFTKTSSLFSCIIPRKNNAFNKNFSQKSIKMLILCIDILNVLC